MNFEGYEVHGVHSYSTAMNKDDPDQRMEYCEGFENKLQDKTFFTEKSFCSNITNTQDWLIVDLSLCAVNWV